MGTPNEYVGEQRRAAEAGAIERGYLSEMFCSIQGEGPCVGERHVFVRTAGCSATCSWCDTLYSKVQTPRFVIHDDDAPRPLDNPVGLDAAAERVVAFARRHQPVDAVSLTGGEPLEQAAFVAGLAKRLKAAGLRVYLETNGLHAEPLAAVLPYVDVVAMDIKLPTAVGTELWDEHRRFLEVFRGSEFLAGVDTARSVFVKIVVDAHSRLDEIETAVSLIASVSPSIPLVLQPEGETLLSGRTPRADVRAMLARVEEAQKAACVTLESVRVMPQLHKILNVR